MVGVWLPFSFVMYAFVCVHGKFPWLITVVLTL